MKVVRLLIERYSHGEKQTIGSLYGLSEVSHVVFNCDTLELPWKENQTNVSCIPTGTYKVKKRYSKKFKNHLHITEVTGRTHILIHSGNYFTDILGCVLVGKLGYINDDDVIDVSSSKKTLKSLMNNLEFDSNNEIELEIVNI